MSLSMVVYSNDRGFDLINYMIGILIITLVISFIRTRNLSFVTCATIFGIYLLFVIRNTFFPLHIAGVFVDMMRDAPFTSRINLIPFNFSYASDFSIVIRELVLNTALLIPFGFGIGFLVSFRTKDLLWLAPAVGISIEAMQLVISLMIGYPYRVIDITDVIMNTLGFLTGYGIFRLFAWWYIAMTHRLNIKHVGLTKYVYRIARRATDQENTEYNRFELTR
jgi:glycopeptide antibiotics resistance protein